MSVETVQISENGRIVIPAVYRKAMGLKGGEIVTIRMDDEGLHIQSRAQAIKRAQAIVRKYTKGRKGLVDEFLRERREEGARE